MKRPARARRTQAERRAGTIRSLLDAATDALVEVGYARASIQEICRRAGVSHGGLFRHFPSREALMVAVAEDAGAQVMARFRSRFQAGSRRRKPLEHALGLLREACASRPNQAWYELVMAARTDTPLRTAMAPFARAYYRAIAGLARELLPELAEKLGEGFVPVVEVLVATCDGERFRSFLGASRQGEARRLGVLLGLLERAID